MARRRSYRSRRKRRSSGLNMLIAIDKPYGEVTRSIDNFVSDALCEDKVGHIGTLDPGVTGVVVLAVGQATKLIPRIEDGKRKSYSAVITFGRETDTDDADGKTTRVADVGPQICDADYAKDVLASFVGRGKQRPPQYSAVKVNGVRSYDRARAGEVFELPERDIEVFEATLSGIEVDGGVCWKCDFVVSGGTYIRALARDIGRKVGSAAHLGTLCRTASGNVSLTECVTPDIVSNLGAEGIRKVALDPTKVLGYPPYRLSEKEYEDVQNGRSFRIRPQACSVELIDGQPVSLVRENKLFGVWDTDDGVLRAHTSCLIGVEGVRS